MQHNKNAAKFGLTAQQDKLICEICTTKLTDILHPLFYIHTLSLDSCTGTGTVTCLYPQLSLLFLYPFLPRSLHIMFPSQHCYNTHYSK